MKRRFALSLAILLTAVSCASQMANIKTPEGRQAVYQLEALTRLERLQTAAIEANTAGALADASAIPIVRFTVGAAKTIREVPNGWLASVTTGWTELKRGMNPATAQRFQAIIQTIDAILATVANGDDPLIEICDGCTQSFAFRGAR